MAKKRPKTAHFDDSWKEILEKFLPEFLKLFFPHAYDDIDWSKGVESLDKELSQVAHEAAIGKRLVDKLLKVHRKSGQEVWVLIHVEVQRQWRRNVEERMYIYNSLIYLRYKKPIMSLLVLGDDRPNWRPDRFEYDLWGSQVQLKFQIVKLLDCRERVEELKKCGNPFAFFVIAHLKTLETKKNVRQRLNYKEEIAKEMMDQGFPEEDVRKLFKFIDVLMTLPYDLEQSFLRKIHAYQEEKNMSLIAPFEQIAKQEGIEIGEQRGIEIGEQRGSLKEAQAAIIDILSEEFGEIPSSLMKSVNSLTDLAVLRELRMQALEVDSLKEFNQLLREFKKQEKR